MPITGSQKALMYCQSGVERCGATRTGYCNGRPFISINGVQRGANVHIASLSINQELNETPDACSLTVDGFTPVNGQEIIITLGSQNRLERLFGGRILKVEAIYLVDKPANQAWRLTATDYTRLLGQRLVTKTYTATSATAILLDLIATFSTGFFTSGIQSGLDVVDNIELHFETLPDAITRVMKLIGGHWYVDYSRVVHAWVGTESGVTNPRDLTSTHPTLHDFSSADDLLQVTTRVIVEGLGTTTVGAVTASATSIPVDSVTMFSAAGGHAVSGNQRFDYTGTISGGGTSLVGYTDVPGEGPLAVTTGSGTNQLTANSWYTWATTSSTGAGETPPGPRGPAYLSDASIKGADLSHLALCDPSVTTRKLYRTAGQASAAAAGTATLQFEQNLGNLTATAFTNFGIGDFALGAAAPTITTGRTTLPVRDCSQFNSGGGSVLVSGMVVKYTGRSVSSGPGDLTGVPSSGSGSITGTIATGEAVTNLSVLTGVSGLTSPLNAGDEINLLAVVDDTAAQTALAALIGGDGIQEYYEQNQRLSLVEATATGTAKLELYGAADVSIEYVSRDVTTTVGRDVVVVSLLGVSGTFKAQEVRIDGFAADGRSQPFYHVKAANKLFTFEDLIGTIYRKKER